MTRRVLLKRIVVDPKIMLGKPVIKGTRLPVEIIIEKVAYGATIENLRKTIPFLKKTRYEPLSCTLLNGSPTKKSTKLKPLMFNL
jgi:uncharacterized protein (DUF433 family)